MKSSVQTLGSFVFLGLLVACQPKDENVKRPYKNPFAQAKVERAQVTGLDYLQYTAYRLNEIKRLVEFIAQPAPQVSAKAPDRSCGRLILDKTENFRRMIRLETRDCKLSQNTLADLSLFANGEEMIDVQYATSGSAEPLRIVLNTLGPYSVQGKIGGKGEMKDSLVQVRENRQMALDLMRTASGVSYYRFSYAVGLNWRQELVTKSFKAFEDNGQNLLNLSGELALSQGKVESLVVYSADISASVPREVVERVRKNKNAPGKTFHNVSLQLAATEGVEKGTLAPLVLEAAQCGLPVGKLKVSKYSNSTTDSKLDKLTSQKFKDIELTALGIRSEASGQTALWADCRPSLSFPLPGGGQGGWQGSVPPITVDELGNRVPYVALFFK